MMEQEITPLGILSLLETSKEQRSTFVAEVVNRMLGGYVESIDVHLHVKCMEEIVKAIRANPDYKALVLESAQRHGKTYQFKNAKVEVRNAAGKWDYSHDEEWRKLKDQLSAREDYLKALPAEGIEVLKGDELVRDMPAKYTQGETSVFVTLK